MYRKIIEREFISRVKKNSAYSMRAFARDLEISNSFLANILNGSRNLSKSRATELAKVLKLSKIESEILLLSAAAESSKKSEDRALAHQDLNKILELHDMTRDLSLEEFKSINDWTYLATLSLFGTVNFDCDERSLAERLNISTAQSKRVLSTLLKLGLVEKQNDVYKVRVCHTRTPTDVPSSEIQNYHRKTIKKASESLAKPLNQREFQTLIFPCDKKFVLTAKEKIKDLMFDFIKASSENPKKDSVFQLSVQLFRLD